jgi:hypothetical protein
MPWRVKRLLYLILLAVAMLVLAGFVLVRDKSVDTELLGTIAVLGGVAILITNLPADGNGNGKP